MGWITAFISEVVVPNIVFFIVLGFVLIGIVVLIATAPSELGYERNGYLPEELMQIKMSDEEFERCRTHDSNMIPLEYQVDFRKRRREYRRDVIYAQRQHRPIPLPGGTVVDDNKSERSREFIDTLKSQSPTSTPAELASHVIDIDDQVKAAATKFLATLEDIGSTFDSNIFSVLDRLATRRGYRITVGNKGVFGNYVRFEKLP